MQDILEQYNLNKIYDYNGNDINLKRFIQLIKDNEELYLDEIYREIYGEFDIEHFKDILNNIYGKISTKPNYKYQNFVNIQNFDLKKLIKIIKIYNNNYRAIYNYSQKFSNWFMFEIDFYELLNNPKLYVDKFSKYLILDIENKKELMESFEQYDKFIENYMNKQYDDYKFTTQLHKKQLKLYINSDNLKKYNSQIINYYDQNINCKYEIIDTINKNITSFLKYGKEIRILAYPVTWINKDKKIYGNKLILWKMEVKHKNNIIKSIIDVKSKNMKNFIKTVSI